MTSDPQLFHKEGKKLDVCGHLSKSDFMPRHLFLALLFGCWLQIGCSSNSRLTAFETSITNKIGNTKVVLGAKLGDWMRELGDPQVVLQRDEGHTFFYWPAAGLGAFCHPHYHRQYFTQQTQNWTVTSIYVPLANTVHPGIPPVSGETKIYFSRVLFTKEEVLSNDWQSLGKVRRHPSEGPIEALEIRKPDRLFIDYD